MLKDECCRRRQIKFWKCACHHFVDSRKCILEYFKRVGHCITAAYSARLAQVLQIANRESIIVDISGFFHFELHFAHPSLCPFEEAKPPALG